MPNSLEEALRRHGLPPATFEDAPGTGVARTCVLNNSGREFTFLVTSAHSNYELCFVHRLTQQGSFWTADRIWSDKGKLVYAERFAYPIGWNTVTEMLADVEPWLTVEFGQVLEASLATSPLRDILNWIVNDGSDLDLWPLELGHGIYVRERKGW